MVKSGTIQPSRLTKPTCLRCGAVDQLAQVGAVVRDGKSSALVRGAAIDRYGYVVPVDTRALQTTALASALAPPTIRRPTTGPAVAGGIGALSVLWCLQLALASPGSAGAWCGAALLAVVAAGFGSLPRARRGELDAGRSLIARARSLWRLSWYCHRCGVVSVLTPNGSAIVEANCLAESLIALARRTVWTSRAADRPTSAAETAK